jgi:hypothetical protein
MKQDMSDWMKEYAAKQEKEKQTIELATKTILDAIKGVDRVGCLPSILANLFEAIEYEDANMDLNNQMVRWGNETYVGRKLGKLIPNLEILYNFCKEKEYTEDNTWEWGAGDRTVCYIPNDKKIILFENQNVQFVVVFDGYKIHVREVFRSLINDNDQYFYGYDGTGYSSVDELRQALKQDNGLEIAICNLTGKYSRYSNSIEGNKYPDRIDLDNMKDNNFGESSMAFRYGDNRDCGYIFSTYKHGFMSVEKCEINDMNKAAYVFGDMVGAAKEIPKKYVKAFKRDSKLNEILD